MDENGHIFLKTVVDCLFDFLCRVEAYLSSMYRDIEFIYLFHATTSATLQLLIVCYQVVEELNICDSRTLM